MNMVNMRVDSPPICVDSENQGDRKSSDDDDEQYMTSLQDSKQDLQHLEYRVDSSGNAENPGQRGPEPDKRMRREIANSNERRRMQSINQGFQSLRALLPRKDGEKMSKASILQQTAEQIRILQNDKLLLSQKNAEYKQRLESMGAYPAPVAGSGAAIGAQENKAAAAADPTIKTVLAPPKKRRRFEMINDSSDEGVGMCSDYESTKISPQMAVTAEYPVKTTGYRSATDKPSWEADLMNRQLLELRLALDRERRLRMVLEDQMRTTELSRLQNMRLPSVPLMDCGTMPSHRPLSPTPMAAPTVSAHLPHHAPMSSLQSATPTGSLAYPPAPQVSTTPSVLPAPLQPSVSAVKMDLYHPATADVGVGVAAPVLTTLKPAAAATPAPSSAYWTPSNSDSCKQNLEVIVEAIRHLEGDQLFVDVGSSNSTSGSHLHHPGGHSLKGSSTGSNPCATAPRQLDSGISSPVCDRLITGVEQLACSRNL